MTIVKPEKGRSTITDQGYKLEISIPSKKNIFIMLFLTAWLGGWFMGEKTVLGHVLFSDTLKNEAFFFSIFWLIGWTIGGAWCIWILLWNISGVEVISVHREILAIERKSLIFKTKKEYMRSAVKNLRLNVNRPGWFSWGYANEFWGYKSGNISFDYGMKTVRFGGSLDDAESQMIVDRINEKIVRHA